MPYWSLYALELGANKEMLGILAMIQAGTLLILQVPGGMPFMVVYAVEIIGLSKSQWGFISMITVILSVALGTIGGHLSDKIGRKPCLLFSRIVEPLSKLFFIRTNNLGR